LASYTELPASSRLSRYVECYWFREDTKGTPDHWVLPDGCVDILFSACRGASLELSVVGLMTTRKPVAVPPGQFFFGVRFHPGMGAAFIPEAAQLTDRIEPFENILGAAGRRLLEQLADSATPAEKVGVIDGFLRPLEPGDRSEKALLRLTDYDLSIDQAARDSGISLRHLRRTCLERSGVSPKFLTRILRFRRAAEAIQAASGSAAQPNWAAFAASHGYFDQAHFIREFQEFTGCTPGRYLQSLPGRHA
jgi:AraC-like DNA-binding protein